MTIRRENCRDFELKIRLQNAVREQIDIDYSQDREGICHAVVRIAPTGVSMLLRSPDGEQELKRIEKAPTGDVRLIRRGSYARVLFDDRELWLQGGTGFWLNHYQAKTSTLLIEDAADGILSCTYTPLHWFPSPEKPCVEAGPEGSFYEQQILPGAVLEHEGTWYMYCMAGRKGDEEGASARCVALCTSSDLNRWEIRPEPLVKHGTYGLEKENLFPGACLKRDDGKFILLMSVQDTPRWLGVYALAADDPSGPFELCEKILCSLPVREACSTNSMSWNAICPSAVMS